MSKLGHPVVYRAHEGHHVESDHPDTGEKVLGSLHHAGMREFAGIVGRVHADDTCDLIIFVPNKEPRWVDGVAYGFGPHQFSLFHHEPEELDAGGESETQLGEAHEQAGGA